MSDQGEDIKRHQEHGRKYHFFVDGVRYDSDQASLTGADIKRMAQTDPTYQLFLEAEGNDPDQPIADSTGIDLTHGAKHFYTAPPATFGGL